MGYSLGWLLGLLLGMRHALEPDHLAAVSTLVASERSARRGALLGLYWGLGHSAALFGVGGVLAVLHRQMPPRAADGFELLVAAMLVALGVRAMRAALRPHDDAHDHAHAGAHAHARRPARGFAARSLVVGLVHGTAGSGALTALVVAELPSTVSRLAYVALFGAGSIAGMALLSGLAGWPLARLGRSGRAATALAAATGAISTVAGLAWGWPLLRALVG